MVDRTQRFQADGYHCGVWVYFAAECFFGYLTHQKDNNLKVNTFSISEVSTEVNVFRESNDTANNAFIASKRLELKLLLQGACLSDDSKYPESIDTDNVDFQHILNLIIADEASNAACEEESKENCAKFFYEAFPEHVKFQVASVYAQHTLWNTQTAENGKQHIGFLYERHWSYYFNKLDVNALYWNYDLKSVVECTTPRATEQVRRSSKKLNGYEDYSVDRLIKNHKDIIADHGLINN